MNPLSIDIIMLHNKTHCQALIFAHEFSVNWEFLILAALMHLQLAVGWGATLLILAGMYYMLEGWLAARWSKMTLVRTVRLPATISLIL